MAEPGLNGDMLQFYLQYFIRAEKEREREKDIFSFNENIFFKGEINHKEEKLK